MKHDREQGPVARRSFLSRMVAGSAALGGALFGASSAANAQSSSAGTAPFQPAKHSEDDWLDQTTAKHRFFYDTTSANGYGQALFFARNYFVANATGYKLADADLAQVLCMRHESTSFAFNDAMWAKYGPALSERAGHFVDPKTKQIPSANVYLASGYGDLLPNGNVTIEQLTKRGVRLAVCSMATRAAAQLISTKSGANVDAVFKELTENLVPGGRMVPAGIVAVNRAQERGYSFVYVV